MSFEGVPVDGREHELSLYMEDTMWPYQDKFAEYIDRCGDVYARSLERRSSKLKIRAAFPTPPGSHLRPEQLLELLRAHIPTEHRNPAPGCTTPLTCATNGPAAVAHLGAVTPVTDGR